MAEPRDGRGPRPTRDAAGPAALGRREPSERQPTGRWAVELTEENRVIGGMTLLYLPPGGMDLEVGWQLAPAFWGHGYATEAGHALAHWAFEYPGVDEVFAVVRPINTRGAATAKRIGMEWVGETDKYYDLQLQVYRIRPADLDRPLADQQYGADQHRPLPSEG